MECETPACDNLRVHYAAAVEGHRGPRQRAYDVDADPRDDASYVFSQRDVRTYELTIDPADLARIDRKPSAEETVPATLHFEGRTYGPLGVRYKGSVGSFLAPCTAASQLGSQPGPKVGKCSFKIEFDEVDKRGRFYGLKKLNLHSMGRDPSMMRERLGYQLYRDMGIAAPRTAHARLVINGQLEGLFLAVEQIDGQFTRSRFGDGGEGNLYKEVWPLSADPAPYRKALETNKGPDTDVDRMLRFRGDLQENAAEAAARWTDVDYMLRYLAVDRVIQNDDGMAHWYCNMGPGNSLRITNHNYYWYEERDADRQWLVPWDLDGSFANEPRVHILSSWSDLPRAPSDCACRTGKVGLPQRAPACDTLTGAFAMVREQYDERVDAFLRGPFSDATTRSRLSTWARQIAPYVEEAAGVRGAPDAYTWQERLDALRDVIDSSRAHGGFDYPPRPPIPETPSNDRDDRDDEDRRPYPTEDGHYPGDDEGGHYPWGHEDRDYPDSDDWDGRDAYEEEGHYPANPYDESEGWYQEAYLESRF